MKRSIIFFISFVMVIGIANGYTQDLTVDWNQYNNDVNKFLKSGDDSLITLAMQMIILNPDKVKAHNEIYKIYNFFRFHEKSQIRQLALVTLYRLNYSFILKNLANDYYTESNRIIRNQITAILKEKPVLLALK